MCLSGVLEKKNKSVDREADRKSTSCAHFRAFINPQKQLNKYPTIKTFIIKTVIFTLNTLLHIRPKRRLSEWRHNQRICCMFANIFSMYVCGAFNDEALKIK